jgi:hypothetical protein
MEETDWQVSVHGGRVVVRFPFEEEGEGVAYAYNTSADDARELAEAILAAADATGAAEDDPPKFERI